MTRVWDLYFLKGPSILYKTGLAMLKLLGYLLMIESLPGIMKVLNSAADYITDGDILVE